MQERLQMLGHRGATDCTTEDANQGDANLDSREKFVGRIS